MADVTVESAILENGTLTVTGSGFTRTTTGVEIDGNQFDFDIPADITDGTKLTVADVPEGAQEVDVTKGEVTQTAAITGGSGEQSAEPDTQTSSSSGGEPEDPYPAEPEDDDGLADASPGQLDEVERQRRAQNPDPVEQGTYTSKEHLGESNVNETVAGTKLDRIDEEWGIGPRDPYPTGRPSDPGAARKRMGLSPLSDDEEQPGRGAA